MTPTRHIALSVFASYALGALVAGLVTCAVVPRGQVIDKPGLSDAQAFIWREGYGRADASPLVRLVTGGELTCTDPVSKTPGFTCGPRNLCRNGCTIIPSTVSVAWWEGVAWWQTPLVHEDGHALLLREGIEAMQMTPVEAVLELLRDWDHQNEIWKPLDKCNPQQKRCGLVAQVNGRLAERESR